MTITKRQAFAYSGWIMILYALINTIPLMDASSEISAISADPAIKGLALTMVYIIFGLIMLVDILAGIAAINLNMKFGMAMFIVLVIAAVVYLISAIINGAFTWDVVRTILVPVVYGLFMFPAMSETKNLKLEQF